MMSMQREDRQYLKQPRYPRKYGLGARRWLIKRQSGRFFTFQSPIFTGPIRKRTNMVVVSDRARALRSSHYKALSPTFDTARHSPHV